MTGQGLPRQLMTFSHPIDNQSNKDTWEAVPDGLNPALSATPPLFRTH
jgi:hypothetical protein